jgi:hypothetical protein
VVGSRFDSRFYYVLFCDSQVVCSNAGVVQSEGRGYLMYRSLNAVVAQSKYCPF